MLTRIKVVNTALAEREGEVRPAHGPHHRGTTQRKHLESAAWTLQEQNPGMHGLEEEQCEEVWRERPRRQRKSRAEISSPRYITAVGT